MPILDQVSRKDREIREIDETHFYCFLWACGRAGSGRGRRCGAARTAASRSSPTRLRGPCTGRSSRPGSRRPTARASSFTQSYAASTDQARAVAAGLKADIVFLSTGDDVNLLVDAGLVDPNWDKQSYRGIEADTVVVFAVRNGNPKHIKAWADLIKPGVQVITPNPFSSGSAKWNVLAAYGAQRRLGKTDAQAQALRRRRSSSTSSRRTPPGGTRRTRSSPARATCCSPTRARRSPRARRARTSST